MWIFESIIAMVAGSTFWLKIIDSNFCAHSKFWGKGIPWLIIVDSKATTGLLSARAFYTSFDSTTHDGSVFHVANFRKRLVSLFDSIILFSNLQFQYFLMLVKSPFRALTNLLVFNIIIFFNIYFWH